MLVRQLIFLLLALAASQVQTIKASQATFFVGKEATVCGKVESARYAKNSNGKPTFLNLDKTFPNQVFTVVIFEDVRQKFPRPPEDQFSGKVICVVGSTNSMKLEAFKESFTEFRFDEILKEKKNHNCPK